MNNKELINELAEESGYTKEDSQRLVKSLIDTMSEDFEKGENVTISGFGTFEVKKRMERVLVNPTTGKKMLVPPKLVLGFKPSNSIKEQLKKK
ncbi:MAG: HU family DNA-binding protein [Prevotella sp.]|nr:HU family DNA-binding protein [Prevotella sp.]